MKIDEYGHVLFAVERKVDLNKVFLHLSCIARLIMNLPRNKR